MQFGKIHFGKIQFGKIQFEKIHKFKTLKAVGHCFYDTHGPPTLSNGSVTEWKLFHVIFSALTRHFLLLTSWVLGRC